jgi:hypothetical protein
MNDGDIEPVIATEAGRCAVPAVESEPVTRADVESAAEAARRASNCARIPRFQHLQRLPHGLAAPPTALAAGAYSDCRLVCRTAYSSCRITNSGCRTPTALAASLAPVAAGANNACRVT